VNNSGIERVAETHYMILPALKNALTQQILTPEGQQLFPDCSTYWDVWTRRLSDKFFDMGTLIRAAASVETALRDYYVLRKGYTNLTQLRQDSQFKENIFQRIMPWHKTDGAISLLTSVDVDLRAIQELPQLQELMLHRHLYAHNLGVIDDKYIDRLKKLTGRDLMADPGIRATYPAQDVYWFEPLSRLNLFIEAVRGFFRKLP
jgi:hypothetical protein